MRSADPPTAPSPIAYTPRHLAERILAEQAALSLSRLWRQQGKRDATRELLAPVYHWFTEGFDTKDLQEAKGLLEALQ